MDKTKTMLGSIIGLLICSGAIAWAATATTPVKVNVDTAISTDAYNFKAGSMEKDATLDQTASSDIAAKWEADYMRNVTTAMRNAYTKVIMTKDTKAMIAATQCMEDALKAATPIEP